MSKEGIGYCGGRRKRNNTREKAGRGTTTTPEGGERTPAHRHNEEGGEYE